MLIRVNFTVSDLILELNTIKLEGCRSKIGDIKNRIRIWTPRFLTPIGKITIIKSLLLSKITNVLLPLPTPTKSLLEEIDQMFKDFLWDKKLQNLKKRF